MNDKKDAGHLGGCSQRREGFLAVNLHSDFFDAPSFVFCKFSNQWWL
jgi:hypothetical protein